MRRRSVLRAVLLVPLAILGSWMLPESAEAAGESCSVFSPCRSSLDYCRFVSITRSVCTRRGTSGQGCTGLGQGTCRSGLVCDIRGECRSNPPRRGEPCGIGVPCASGLVCSADVGGRCEDRGGSGDACSGVGRGSCASGLVCDALRECRHDPPLLGELCGTGVPCGGGYACDADVAGRCRERGGSGEACSGIGQGSCASGLVCDALRVCRHDPPLLGEPCGTGVPCAAEFGCSAEVGGVCEPRDEAGEICSGIGQGSCQDGLVCDALRTCRHDPPLAGEPCGPGVGCANGLFCQAGSQQCRALKTVGEGCSVFNPCLEGLSCEACFTESCDFPFQCFPNRNEGAITEQQCRTLYSPALHQSAFDTGLAVTYGAGNGIGAGLTEAQQFGVVYGPDGSYGCFTSLCVGVEVDVEITAGFVSVGFYDEIDSVGGSSTAFLQEAEIAAVANFSTSQIFERFSLDPFDIGTLIGTEDCFSVGLSALPFPFSAGVYACETVLDTLVDPANGDPDPDPLAPSLCGDLVLDPGEACDDGNRVNGDGCSTACTLEAMCGNGVVDEAEECDDGGTAPGDGCSASCTVESFCGDGRLDPGEGCDDANTTPGDGCSEICRLEDADQDGIDDDEDNCLGTYNPDQLDTDDDGRGDACDNCIETPNADQLDSDGDLYGNVCDGDLNGDELPFVGQPDLAQLRLAIGKRRTDADCPADDGTLTASCEEFDLNGDGLLFIGQPDLAAFRLMLGRRPGPSAFHP